MAGRLAVATLLALVVGKLVIWWIALGSGTSGGTLAPIQIISFCFGALAGQVLAQAVPGLGVAPSAFALVAMAATFDAAARAPFAAIIFLFELTRDYNAILPLMLATVLADLLARRMVEHSIMTEKLARRGVSVPGAYHPDPLRGAPVRMVMQQEVVTIDADADLGKAERLLAESGHEALPVTDGGGALVGIVSPGDLLEPGLDPGSPVARVAIRDVVVVGPGESVYAALSRMVEEGVDHLPVVDGGRVVGMCTRADLLQVRIRELDQERVERGWLPARLPSIGP